jgi:hypothetical protein
LDRKALGSGGYKMNRNQLVGKIAISALKNPALLDQTLPVAASARDDA